MSSLQNCEKIHFCSWSRSFCGTLLCPAPVDIWRPFYQLKPGRLEWEPSLGQSVCFNLVFFRKRPEEATVPLPFPLTSHPPPTQSHSLGKEICLLAPLSEAGHGEVGLAHIRHAVTESDGLSQSPSTSAICHDGEKPQKDLIFTLFPQTAPSPWSLSRDFTLYASVSSPHPYFFF